MRWQWFVMGSAMLLFLSADIAHAGRSLASRIRYGNFCGVDHGNNSPKKPIDQLDKACKRHDLCCKNPAKIAGAKVCPCHCDRDVRRAAKAFLRTKRGRKNKKARRMARLIKTVYSAHACYCKGRVCKFKIRCKKKCRKIFRKKRCIRVPKCRIEKKCGQGKKPGLGGKCMRCKIKKKCKRYFGKKFCFKIPSCRRK